MKAMATLILAGAMPMVIKRTAGKRQLVAMLHHRVVLGRRQILGSFAPGSWAVWDVAQMERYFPTTWDDKDADWHTIPDDVLQEFLEETT
jgi:hypothetical protein